MLKPCGYRLLVKPEVIEDTTEWDFKIIIDEKLERAAQVYGEVVSVGSECWKGDTPWAEVGDRVCYVKHSGKFITDPETDEEFVILNDEDILIVLSGERK